MSRVPWITTRQFTIDLFPAWSKTEGDKEWSLGSVTIDLNMVSARLEALIDELNADQWEIKMVVPLDKSLTFHEHQKVTREGNRKEAGHVIGAFGLGWAAGTTAAFIVVAQRTEWLEESEYRARLDQRNAREAQDERRKMRAALLAQNAAINTRINNAQKELADLRANDIVARKSGLLRTERFLFGGAEYASHGEAVAARAARARELEDLLQSLPRELKLIPQDE